VLEPILVKFFVDFRDYFGRVYINNTYINPPKRIENRLKLFTRIGSYIEIYRKNLKNRGFGKEASQNSSLEQATIVRAQGASEDKDFEKQPTLPKTDSSGSFGIK
jgi:hypothetical protein